MTRMVKPSTTHFTAPMRWRIASLLVPFFAVLCAAPAWGAYPEKPIKLVVPYVPGSTADTVGRAVAEGLAKRLQQAVVVENRPGGNAQIGTEAAARAPADGYTLLLGNLDSHVLNALLYTKLRYQPERDFTPLAMVGVTHLILVSGTALDAKNVVELIAAAKRAPGKLNYGTWGLGSAAHLWMSLLEQTAGIDMTHIPYQGTPQAMNALLGNQIDLMFLPPSLAVASQQAGKLRIIGSTAPVRSVQFPKVPTLAEQPALGGFEASTWFALYAPAGLPVDIAALLNRETNTVLQMPELRLSFQALALAPLGGSAAVLAQTMSDERVKWARVIATRKISPLD